MAEPKRLESVGSAEGNDRDTRTESLLVEGLDRYFAGRYEDAIHLWTRVLFLDRAHARARAYIDRARSALSERQRQAEEMLHATSALLAEGQAEQARDLLAQAVAANADDESLSALRERLERLERAGLRQLALPRPSGLDAQPIREAKTPRFFTLTLASVVIAAAVIGMCVPAVVNWIGRAGGEQPLASVAPKGALPTLSIAEAAILRARTFYARGRLAEALVALDRVDARSSLRAEADRLRVEIQQVLLATSASQRATP